MREREFVVVVAVVCLFEQCFLSAGVEEGNPVCVSAFVHLLSTLTD